VAYPIHALIYAFGTCTESHGMDEQMPQLLLRELKREAEGGNKVRPKEGRHGGDLG
jgi:hypothetical protein